MSRHGPPAHWESGRRVTDWVPDPLTGYWTRWVRTADGWDQEEDRISPQMRALGRTCYRCRGLGWDRYLHGDDPSPQDQWRGFWSNCRDCHGTGKAPGRAPQPTEEIVF